MVCVCGVKEVFEYQFFSILILFFHFKVKKIMFKSSFISFLFISFISFIYSQNILESSLLKINMFSQICQRKEITLNYFNQTITLFPFHINNQRNLKLESKLYHYYNTLYVNKKRYLNTLEALQDNNNNKDNNDNRVNKEIEEYNIKELFITQLNENSEIISCIYYYMNNLNEVIINDCQRVLIENYLSTNSFQLMNISFHINIGSRILDVCIIPDIPDDNTLNTSLPTIDPTPSPTIKSHLSASSHPFMSTQSILIPLIFFSLIAFGGISYHFELYRYLPMSKPR